MGLDWKYWLIKVKLMTFAFAGQIFQFIARPGIVDNYGFNFTLRHPLSLWKAKNDEKWHFWKFGPRAEVYRAEVYRVEVVSGPKLFRAKVFPGRSISWPKYSPGRSILRAEVFTGPKLFRAEVFPGQSECRAKAVSGPNWVWAITSI